MNTRSISFTVRDCSSSSRLSWFQSKVSLDTYDSVSSNRRFEGVKVLQRAIPSPSSMGPSTDQEPTWSGR
eukprot:9544517-Prorocentrum_lima.AAC.1